jgi:hypothetical protein
MERVTLDSTEVQPTITYVPHPYPSSYHGTPWDGSFYHQLVLNHDGKIEIGETIYSLCTGLKIPKFTQFVEFDSLLHPILWRARGELTEEELATLIRNFNVYLNNDNPLTRLYKFDSNLVTNNPREATDCVFNGFGGSFTYKNKYRITVTFAAESFGIQYIRVDPDTDTLTVWQHSIDHSVKYEYHLKDHVYIPLLAESSLPDELCMLILRYI